jgi:hypothetical protein
LNLKPVKTPVRASDFGSANARRSYFRPTSDVKRLMIRIHRRSIIPCALLMAALGALPAYPAAAQTAPAAAQTAPAAVQSAPAAAQSAPDGAMQISWEVRNRFRLFREERDFLLHTDSARDQTILGSEQALELQSDGRGWARNTVNRLCIDLAGSASPAPGITSRKAT